MSNFGALLHFLTRGESAPVRTHYTQEIHPMSAPRIQYEDVLAAVQAEDFVVMPDRRTTICQLTLTNGFTVRGESSCVCVENFNPETGRDIARRNAEEKVWLLLGYALAERLYREAQAATSAAP